MSPPLVTLAVFHPGPLQTLQHTAPDLSSIVHRRPAREREARSQCYS